MRSRRIFVALSSAALIASMVGASALAQDGEQATVQPTGTLPGDPSIALVQVTDGLVDPISVTNAGDGSGRVFVVERIGQVRIVDGGGALVETPFLDISGSVKVDFLEQGLLGLAFHPDYASTGQFYVYYSDYATNGNLRIVRYNVSADDANVADPDSAQLVLEIADDPYTNHNGGTLQFGPDGYLYWATGDGGLAGDPYDNAQNRRNPYGKIHRIDVDTTSAELNYSIPSDNPFAESSKVSLRPEDPATYHPGADATIWSYGLRNPWRFSFDPTTGDLYIADVGQNAWEEVDFQEAGAAGGQNYGWDWMEASHCYPATVTDCPRGQVGVLPVAEYDHATGDCSISGLGVSRSTDSPLLDGVYLNSDFCSGRVYGLARDDSGAWQYQMLLDTALLVPGGGTDEAGNVYLTSCECGFSRDYDPVTQSKGALWKVVEAANVADGAITAPPEPDASPAPEASAPGETQAPAESSAPEATDAPATTAPEASPPAATKAPAETPAPDSSAAAETTSPAETTAPDSSAAVESPAASAAAEGDTVTLVDIAFQPRKLTIAADTATNISLPNTGAAVHTFVIDELDINVEVAPGETGSVTIDAPAGKYVYYCDVPGHREAGMEGTLTVK